MKPLDRITNENIDDNKTLNVWRFKSEIEKMVHNIANGNFSEIETSVAMGETSIDDLQRVLREYGCSIAPLPDNALSLAETYNIESENRLDVYLPLWTKEEGRSDLTLFLSCFLKNGKPYIEINDLHVL